MKNKIKLFGLITSIVIHTFLLFPILNNASQKNINYSKVNGIKISLKQSSKMINNNSVPKIKKSISKLSNRRKQNKIENKKRNDHNIQKNKLRDIGRKTALDKYLSKVRLAVLKNKHYPPKARRLKQEGTVIITFDIHWPNTITNIKIQKRAPFKGLNLSAIKAISRIKNLEMMPEKLRSQTIKIKLPMIYEKI